MMKEGEGEGDPGSICAVNSLFDQSIHSEAWLSPIDNCEVHLPLIIKKNVISPVCLRGDDYLSFTAFVWTSNVLQSLFY